MKSGLPITNRLSYPLVRKSGSRQLHTGTWTLVADRGNYAGYQQSAVSPYGPASLTAGQTAGTRDAGAASFLRDPSGNLVRTGGAGYVFGASTLMETLSVGPCRVTGRQVRCSISSSKRPRSFARISRYSRRSLKPRMSSL